MRKLLSLLLITIGLTVSVNTDAASRLRDAAKSTKDFFTSTAHKVKENAASAVNMAKCQAVRAESCANPVEFKKVQSLDCPGNTAINCLYNFCIENCAAAKPEQCKTKNNSALRQLCNACGGAYFNDAGLQNGLSVCLESSELQQDKMAARYAMIKADVHTQKRLQTLKDSYVKAYNNAARKLAVYQDLKKQLDVMEANLKRQGVIFSSLEDAPTPLPNLSQYSSYNNVLTAADTEIDEDPQHISAVEEPSQSSWALAKHRKLPLIGAHRLNVNQVQSRDYVNENPKGLQASNSDTLGFQELPLAEELERQSDEVNSQSRVEETMAAQSPRTLTGDSDQALSQQSQTSNILDRRENQIPAEVKARMDKVLTELKEHPKFRAANPDAYISEKSDQSSSADTSLSNSVTRPVQLKNRGRSKSLSSINTVDEAKAAEMLRGLRVKSVDQPVSIQSDSDADTQVSAAGMQADESSLVRQNTKKKNNRRSPGGKRKPRHLSDLY